MIIYYIFTFNKYSNYATEKWLLIKYNLTYKIYEKLFIYYMIFNYYNQ